MKFFNPTVFLEKLGRVFASDISEKLTDDNLSKNLLSFLIKNPTKVYNMLGESLSGENIKNHEQNFIWTTARDYLFLKNNPYPQDQASCKEVAFVFAKETLAYTSKDMIFSYIDSNVNKDYIPQILSTIKSIVDFALFEIAEVLTEKYNPYIQRDIYYEEYYIPNQTLAIKRQLS